MIAKRLNKLFLTKTAKEWENILLKVNVPVAIVNTIEEVINNSQFQYRGVWSKFNDSPIAGLPALINDENFKVSAKAPLLGEHTNKIVKELGYSKEQIEILNSEKTTPIPLKY